MTAFTPFSTRIIVRSYELDMLGHVNHAVYHQYAEIARSGLLQEAGCLVDDLVANRKAPVLLESHIVFRRELRGGDVVDVSCEAKFGSGKTFSMDSVVTKLDGTVSAEITCTMGVMDLDARKLVADPRAALEAAGIELRSLSGSE